MKKGYVVKKDGKYQFRRVMLGVALAGSIAIGITLIPQIEEGIKYMETKNEMILEDIENGRAVYDKANGKTIYINPEDEPTKEDVLARMNETTNKSK